MLKRCLYRVHWNIIACAVYRLHNWNLFLGSGSRRLCLSPLVMLTAEHNGELVVSLPSKKNSNRAQPLASQQCIYLFHRPPIEHYCKI